jgi:hypothetical protein
VCAYVYIGISSAIAKEYPSPDYRHVAQILEREAYKEEPIVIMGWDASPTAYYLMRDWMTSYDFETELREGAEPSYLILDSQYSRKLTFIDYSNVIYENPNDKIKIIRYIPRPVLSPIEN